MNTRLDPPAVQLPPNVERRVRQRVLDHAVGRQQVRTRRWAPALAAAVGVVAVTATIVVADHSWNGSDAPVAAVPAPPNPIDAGAVTGTERDTAVNACRDATRTPDATVRYVRRVRDYSASPSTTSVAVVMRAKDGGSDLTCTRLRVGVGNDIGNGVRAEPAKTPPAPGSLIPIGSADSYYDPIPGIVGPNGQKGTTVAMPRFYQVHPSVARIETRIVQGHAVGAWYTAAMVDGIAFTMPVAQSTGHGTPPRVEARLFDANGNQIPSR